MWLNFVIKACFSQSTATSESITVATGYCTLDEIRGSESTRTDRIVQAKPWPGTHLKLFGTVAEKSNSVPLSSIRFRIAIKVIIKASWKRSTMSVGYYQVYWEWQNDNITCTCYLEKVVLLEFFEDTSFNFDKLIGHEKSE
jgi:hypothetical protein